MGRSPGEVCSGTQSQSASSSKLPYSPSKQCFSVPQYLSSYFITDVPSWIRLRSPTSNQLIVPSYNLATVDRQAFPVSAANLWNSLRAHLTSAPSLTVFRQRLKTFLFRCRYPDLITLGAYIRAYIIYCHLHVTLNSCHDWQRLLNILVPAIGQKSTSRLSNSLLVTIGLARFLVLSYLWL